MKKIKLLLLLQLLTFALSAQKFKSGDKVEIDQLMSRSREGNWMPGTVSDFDSVDNMYTVRLRDGVEVGIVSRDPEKWIRAATGKGLNAVDFSVTGPAGGITYENRNDIMPAPDCNPSEAYLKKKIRAQVAKDHFRDFPMMAVDITSWKGQNGYDDKKYAGQVVYPFKIEMMVYIKRKVMKDGKEKTEYQTWKFDRVYEYATRAGGKCEFYAVPANDSKMISSEIF